MIAAKSGEERAYHHGNLRAALVEAGLELARTGGPAAVVLRAASRQAGVSHNAVYRHFASQEHLLAAVAQRCMQQLSALMITRMNAVTARGRTARASARMEAIGRAYIDFARTEPGWFRTAFSSSRAHPPVPSPDETSPAQPEVVFTDSVSEPNPYEILMTGLDDLVEAGILAPERRPGAQYAAWSKVHGLSTLLLDGPLHDLPESEVQFAINTVLSAGMT